MSIKAGTLPNVVPNIVSSLHLTTSRGHLGPLPLNQPRSTHPTLLRSQRRTNSLRCMLPDSDLHPAKSTNPFPYNRTINPFSSAPSTTPPNQPNTPPTPPPQPSPASPPPATMSPAVTSPVPSASGTASAKAPPRANTQSSAAASTI